MKKFCLLSVFALIMMGAVLQAQDGPSLEKDLYEVELALDQGNYQNAKGQLMEIQSDSMNMHWSPNQLFLYKSYWAKYYQFTEQYDKAFKGYEHLVDWARGSKTDHYASGLIKRAEFFRYTFKADAAQADLDSVASLMKHHSIDSGVLLSYYSRAAAVTQQFFKDHKRAEELCLMSLELARAINDSMGIAVALNELGFFYENRRNSLAFDYYKEALHLFECINMPRYQINVLINLARAYHHFDQSEKGYEYSKVGVERFRGKESSYALESLFEFHYHITKKLGKFAEALDAYEEYHRLFTVYQNQLHRKELHQMEAQYGAQLKDLQLQQKDQELIQKDEALGLLERNRVAMIFVIAALFIIAVITFMFLNRIGEKNRVLDGLYQQRKTLMRESNHRIKNNLQLIITLIQKELNKDRNSPALLNLRAKIEAIGSLHRQLYLDDNLEEVELKNYLMDLVRNLEDLIKEHQATLKIEVSPCSINFDKAVYLGLILTELIMNSVKHGFPSPDARPAEIACLINVWENHLYFHYSDNGKGFASPNSNAALIRLLVSQMEGEMKQSSDNGAFTQINIPL